ncbi:hypothetical protein evm_008341 [Chilo suppressalis]|nr:hypothetical protein evm_008341 [Chilo suppressalis]
MRTALKVAQSYRRLLDHCVPASSVHPTQAPRMDAAYLLLIIAVSATAEHSGAYSSPQYAKKMYPKVYDTNALLPREKTPLPFKEDPDSIARFDSGNDTQKYPRSSFMETAGSFLNSAGGQLVTGLAKDFIARSTGSSQVLSLNLTNLVILIVLKALILAAGFFGAGAWKGNHYARNLDDNKNASYLTEEEILLYLSYLSGQRDKNFGCLYRLSCQKPDQAGLYSSGAEILLQGAKLLRGYSYELSEYEDITKGIKQAVDWGERGGECAKRYECRE